MENINTLQRKILEFEFQPEVYLYPTPRMYMPLVNFSLCNVDFTKDINVYVHIPFCKQICSYCGYLKTIDSETQRSNYVDTIVKEIKLYSEILKNRAIKTLHFGGGTPSLLTSSQLEKIMTALLQANPDLLRTAQEVSLEATPESVEAKKFYDFRNLGINRVSLGIQSFNNSEIFQSNRNNLPDVSVKAIETLRQIGIQNIVLDLMIGIEGQTIKSFEDSVLEAIEFRPETVELYALGLMPHSALGKRHLNLMRNEDIYRCYELGRSIFLRAGYEQDCHNRYAIPGRGSFLQEDYVFQGMSLIGFGAGARSYAKNIHYRNTYDSIKNQEAITRYMQTIGFGSLAVESGIFLDSDEKIRQYIIGHIEALDQQEFNCKFGVQFKEKFGRLHKEMLDLSLAIEDGQVMKLTAQGLIFRDLIAKQFFSESAHKVEGEYRQ